MQRHGFDGNTDLYQAKTQENKMLLLYSSVNNTGYFHLHTGKICIKELKSINCKLSLNIKMVENCKDGIITQDKNLGPFFVDEDLLVETEDRYNPENEQKIIQFTNNVIDYLFLDVTKFNHDVLFEKNITYSEVYDYFTESLPNAIKGTEEAKRYLKIFDSNIEDDIIENQNARLVETNSLEAGDSTDGDSQER